MKFSCPTCGAHVKLSVKDIQKPECVVTCPSCKNNIHLKNNLPVKDGNLKS